MIRKVFGLILLLILIVPVFGQTEELWDNFGDMNFYNIDEHTAVSDEQFDKTVETVKEKQKRKGLFNFKREPKKMKGESYQESNETALIKDVSKDVPVLVVPCELLSVEGNIIPIGHYQAVFEKKNDKIFMKLYQAHYKIAQFIATETEEDLFDDKINYITLEDFSDNQVKINYGSIDFNAFVIIEKIKGSK